MRLAWFAPMLPDEGLVPRDLSMDAIPLVSDHHGVEVFAGSALQAHAWQGWHVPVRDPHDFVWRARQRPYDLIVYQLSNSPRHDYVWGYVWNFPGLVVLQDEHLHHARARILLDRVEPRLDDYAAELNYNHDLEADAHLAFAPFTGPLLHIWPMRRAAVAGARGVAVHSEALADAIRHESPEAAVHVVRPGVADPGVHRELRGTAPARDLRDRLGLGGAFVVAVFGRWGASSPVRETLQAIAALRKTHPDVRLLVDGSPDDDPDLGAAVREYGVADRVAWSGAISCRELPACLGAADVALALAWPDTADTLHTWLECAACGLPTIVLDRAAHGTMPVLDLRTSPGSGSAVVCPSRDPVAIAIDPRVRPHELQAAIGRLADDEALRERMGQAARRWWASGRTARAMADDYLEAIARTAGTAAPDVSVPPHLRPDVFEHTRRLLEEVGAVLPDGIGATGRPPRSH